jgi:hypothetical protein
VQQPAILAATIDEAKITAALHRETSDGDPQNSESKPERTGHADRRRRSSRGAAATRRSLGIDHLNLVRRGRDGWQAAVYHCRHGRIQRHTQSLLQLAGIDSTDTSRARSNLLGQSNNNGFGRIVERVADRVVGRGVDGVGENQIRTLEADGNANQALNGCVDRIERNG